MGIPNPTYVSSYLPIPGADARKQLSIEGTATSTKSAISYAY